MEFEWNPAKAIANALKHGVSFEEALAIFSDPHRIDFDVSRHADGEEGRKTVGLLGKKLAVVVYTKRNGIIRVISARRTNKSEEKRYGNRSIPF